MQSSRIASHGKILIELNDHNVDTFIQLEYKQMYKEAKFKNDNFVRG